MRRREFITLAGGTAGRGSDGQSTIAIYTGFAPRWLAILGYTLSLLLLFGSCYLSWSFVVFSLWVLVMSIYIFFDDARTRLAVLERGDGK
jgi:hypothetical protein